MRKLCVIAGLAGLLGATACGSDVLSVPNNDSPDAGRVLARPGDVESLIAGTFNGTSFEIVLPVSGDLRATLTPPADVSATGGPGTVVVTSTPVVYGFSSTPDAAPEPTPSPTHSRARY